MIPRAEPAITRGMGYRAGVGVGVAVGVDVAVGVRAGVAVAAAVGVAVAGEAVGVGVRPPFGVTLSGNRCPTNTTPSETTSVIS